MKFTRLIVVTGFLLLTCQVSANLLFDITDGKYRAARPGMLRSMNDGEHYTQLKNGTTILKYSYRTGQVTDTLMHLPGIKNSPLKSVSGYIISPKETKILVYTTTEQRFRRSFTADYYI